MATCTEVANFLQQAAARNVSDRLAPADLDGLQQLGLIAHLTPAQVTELQQEVSTLEQAQAAIYQESLQRAQVAGSVGQETRTTHSVLFHLRGVDRQHAELERLGQEQAALKNLDADLAKRQQDFAQLLVKRAQQDQICPYNGDFVAITPSGRLALRDLNVRLYRVGAQSFPDYWAQSNQVDAELGSIANRAALLEGALAQPLSTVNPGYRWAVAIGLAKASPDLQPAPTAFLEAWASVGPLSSNVENRLMAAEVVAALASPLQESVEGLRMLQAEVEELQVPEESALGVAAILLLGRRADGTFATAPLQGFLTATPSYESAALLAIVNRPYDEMAEKFGYLKSLFASWGYSASEDTELSAAFLTTSELPADSISAKVAILARGLAGYLQYPLVGAAILASIPVLEANETLSLVEKAYEILGQRTGPMSQAELISLSVRLIHGVEVPSVDALDPAARPVAPVPSFSYVHAPTMLWLPVFITHNSYYSTFSGIGGPHPGHVHTWGGGGWAGGGFVG